MDRFNNNNSLMLNKLTIKTHIDDDMLLIRLDIQLSVPDLYCSGPLVCLHGSLIHLLSFSSRMLYEANDPMFRPSLQGNIIRVHKQCKIYEPTVS